MYPSVILGYIPLTTCFNDPVQLFNQIEISEISINTGRKSD